MNNLFLIFVWLCLCAVYCHCQGWNCKYVMAREDRWPKILFLQEKSLIHGWVGAKGQNLFYVRFWYKKPLMGTEQVGSDYLEFFPVNNSRYRGCPGEPAAVWPNLWGWSRGPPQFSPLDARTSGSAHPAIWPKVWVGHQGLLRVPRCPRCHRYEEVRFWGAIPRLG